MSDQLFDGHRIRLLTLVDNHTRESPAIHVGQRIQGCEVVQVLERVVKEHGKPQTIQVDNGPEQLFWQRPSSRICGFEWVKGDRFDPGY